MNQEIDTKQVVEKSVHFLVDRCSKQDKFLKDLVNYTASMQKRCFVCRATGGCCDECFKVGKTVLAIAAQMKEWNETGEKVKKIVEDYAEKYEIRLPTT